MCAFFTKHTLDFCPYVDNDQVSNKIISFEKLVSSFPNLRITNFAVIGACASKRSSYFYNLKTIFLKFLKVADFPYSSCYFLSSKFLL